MLERTDLQMTNNPRQVRRIGSNLLWGQIGRVIEIGLSLVFSVLVVRALGPHDYATYSVVWSIIGVAALVASFGYGETLSRYLPELHVGSGRSATLVRRLLSERALVSLVVALGVWAGSTPIAIWTRTPALRSLIGLVAALIVAQGIWELLAGYFNASLRMRDHAVIRFVSQLVSLGLALGLFLGVGVSVWVPLVAVLSPV